MKALNVELGERSYPILIGAGLLQQTGLLNQHIKGSKVMVVTNDTIAPLYLQRVVQHLQDIQVDVLVLPDGEQYKNLDTFNRIISELLEKQHGRDTTLIALGGGVIGDLVGYAAASYQRGVDFIQIPTTVLAQVDSSVGGKTAVNHPLGKNMIGAFHQPKAVIIDIDCLQSLPAREFSAGMAEVIKYGIIWDAAFFDWIEQHTAEISALSSEHLVHMIQRCCAIKAEVVAADEKEHGCRALLNLGHTFGHAIEAEMGYGVWLHGEAVAAGTMMAAVVAEQMQDYGCELTARIQALLTSFALPLKVPASMSFDDFMRHMMRDKKVLDGELRLVLPTQCMGQARVTKDATLAQIRTAIARHTAG